MYMVEIFMTVNLTTKIMKLAPHENHQTYSIIQLTANLYQPEYLLIVFHICSPHKKHKAPGG